MDTVVLKLEGMTLQEKISYTVLLTIGLTLTIVFAVWWFNPSHLSHNFHGIAHVNDYILFAVLSYIVWHQIVMELFSWYVAAYVKHPDHSITPIPKMRVAYLTAFVPGSEPYDILEKTLVAMVEVDYPHDTWLLDEGNDPTAKEICERHGVKHYSRNGKVRFNTLDGKFARKTKGGNYNSWLHHHDDSYDIVAQHDVDFIPTKNFLTRTLGYFRDPSVAFVGTPQVYGNLEDSWITRGAAEQTYGFYGPLQKGFYGHDMTLLIGANHIMRVDAYKDIGGYSAHIVEDMLTGMKLYTHKWKSVYVPEVLLVGEGPISWESYFNQQLRWSYGCMDIVFRHAPTLFTKMTKRFIFNYVLLQQFYFIGIAQTVGVVLLTLYFIFGVTSAHMNFLPILVIYIPLLIYQQLFQLWIQRFNIQPAIERGLLLRGKLLFIAAWPVYFLAFIGAIRRKHLTYVVTPKGSQQGVSYNPALFIPHFVLGTITLVDVLVGFLLDHSANQLMFWALLNTAFMYYFFFAESIPVLVRQGKELYARHVLVPAPVLLQVLGSEDDQSSDR